MHAQVEQLVLSSFQSIVNEQKHKTNAINI